MNTKSDHTAILIFARSAEREASHKKLQHLDSSNLIIHKAFYTLVLNTARGVGLPIVHLTQNEQRGFTFGERIANAFREMFYQGYYNVICIGADCPDLNSEDIEYAHDSIMEGHAVVGPDKRGGAYLIAMNRDMFKSEVFERLMWQTNHLCSDLLLYFNSISVKCELLKSKADINCADDLQAERSSSRVILLINSVNVKPDKIRKKQVFIKPYLGVKVLHHPWARS